MPRLDEMMVRGTVVVFIKRLTGEKRKWNTLRRSIYLSFIVYYCYVFTLLIDKRRPSVLLH